MPAHTTPGITGDSEIAVMVLNALTPSFFESCGFVPATPITVDVAAVDLLREVGARDPGVALVIRLEEPVAA